MLRKRGVGPWVRNRDGHVAVIMALCALPVMLVIGAAIDISQQRSRAASVQFALDHAGTAAARHLTLDETLSDEDLRAIAQKYFKANLIGVTDIDMAALTLERVGGTLQMSVEGELPTGVMYLSGRDTVPLKAASAISYTRQPDLEIAVIIDTSGSMAGEKIDAVKDATKSLIEKLVVPGSTRVKVSVVPFAEYVNIGSHFTAETWLTISTPNNAPRRLSNSWNGCVRERQFPHISSDSTYTTKPVRGFTSWDKSCPSAITPLTNDVAALNVALDSLTTGSGFESRTYFTDALMWGLRTLSSHPPFSEAQTYDAMAAAGGQKVVLFLTDGHMNGATNWFGWVETTYSPMSLAEAVGFSLDACALIKSHDIEIFTIAYEIPASEQASAMAFLTECATSAAHVYEPSDTNDVIDAFEAIADGFVGDIAVVG